MTHSRDPGTAGKPYPEAWEQVADLRVLRGAPDDWHLLSRWTAEMQKQGWRLLRVTTQGDELVAVYGRSKTPDSH